MKTVSGPSMLSLNSEEKAVESNEFLKRLKQAWFKISEAVHGLITGHLWIS